MLRAEHGDLYAHIHMCISFKYCNVPKYPIFCVTLGNYYRIWRIYHRVCASVTGIFNQLMRTKRVHVILQKET